MFEAELEAALGSTARLAELVADNHAVHKLSGCRRLVLAAAWADAHTNPDDRPDRGSRTGESNTVIAAPGRRKPRAEEEGWIQPGGSGTPWIAETCPAEFGVMQQQSAGSARCLIADALDLRHRLPRMWDRVLAGEVHDWKVRAVASRTRYLSPTAVGELDRLICHQIELVSWARFEKILDAALLHVDPFVYGQRAEQSKTKRDVWAGPAAEGLRTLIIRACQGDTAVFLAAVNRVADLLADEGDEDPVGARRTKAVGILGNPAAALDLLNRHTTQADIYNDDWGYGPDPEETQPWEQASRAGWADPRSHFYDQSDPSDRGYQQSQTPPPDDAFEPANGYDEDQQQDQHASCSTCGWPMGDQPRPGRPAADDTDAATSENDLDEPAGPADDPRRPLLPSGGLELRPVTRADRKASRPKTLIIFHLTDEAVHSGRGVVRTDAGPISVDELRQFLTDTDADITVKPVLDPADIAPVDSYEIPPDMRTGVSLRNPDSVFPFGGSSSGRTDLDHTKPYLRGGPPGQTSVANLGPLTRTEHRAKTVGRWTVRQPEPGTYLWRSPCGWIALVTNQGTIMLGNGPYARQLWRNAGQFGALAA